MTDDVDLGNATDEQQWLAMQYVLDELSPEQSAEFETAMADDMSLCEAVSEAVRLCSGVVVAFEAERHSVGLLPVVPHCPKPQSRLTVISACAVLSLTLVVVFVTRPAGAPAIVAEGSASEADVLATLVSDDLPPDSASDSGEDLLTDDSLAALVAPEWLLTAIELDDAVNEPGEFPGQTPEDETDVF